MELLNLVPDECRVERVELADRLVVPGHVLEALHKRRRRDVQVPDQVQRQAVVDHDHEEEKGVDDEAQGVQDQVRVQQDLTLFIPRVT